MDVVGKLLKYKIYLTFGFIFSSLFFNYSTSAQSKAYPLANLIKFTGGYEVVIQSDKLVLRENSESHCEIPLRVKSLVNVYDALVILRHDNRLQFYTLPENFDLCDLNEMRLNQYHLITLSPFYAEDIEMIYKQYLYIANNKGVFVLDIYPIYLSEDPKNEVFSIDQIGHCPMHHAYGLALKNNDMENALDRSPWLDVKGLFSLSKYRESIKQKKYDYPKADGLLYVASGTDGIQVVNADIDNFDKFEKVLPPPTNGQAIDTRSVVFDRQNDSLVVLGADKKLHYYTISDGTKRYHQKASRLKMVTSPDYIVEAAISGFISRWLYDYAIDDKDNLWKKLESKYLSGEINGPFNSLYNAYFNSVEFSAAFTRDIYLFINIPMGLSRTRTEIFGQHFAKHYQKKRNLFNFYKKDLISKGVPRKQAHTTAKNMVKETVANKEARFRTYVTPFDIR
jgi:hypothetical protein